MKNQESRTLYIVTCPCGGAQASVDARSFGKPVFCKKCGNQFTVAWGKDPVTRKNAPLTVSLARKRPATPLRLKCTCGYTRAVTAAEAHRQNRCPGCGKVMIVEKPAAKSRDSNRLIKMSSAPRTSPPMPLLPVPSKETPETKLRRFNPPTPTPNFNSPGLVCECGRDIEVLKALESAEYTCPACGRSVRMEKFKNSQTKHTIIRPIFGPKTPAPMPAAPRTPPKPKPAPEAVFEEDPAPLPENEPAAAASSSSYQELFCPCGEALMIGMEDAGKNIQCPTCLTLMSVDVQRDSKGANGLRVRAIGKMDQDTWSLNDFQ